MRAPCLHAAVHLNLHSARTHSCAAHTWWAHSAHRISRDTLGLPPAQCVNKHAVQAKAAAADPTATDAAPALAPFRRLKAEHLSALRYRAQDVLGGLTKAVAREARAKDLRLEILNSSRLQVRRTPALAVRSMRDVPCKRSPRFSGRTRGPRCAAACRASCVAGGMAVSRHAACAIGRCTLPR